VVPGSCNSINFSLPWSTVRVPVRSKPRNLEIEISDEGRGVDARFLPHLFERFRHKDMESSRRHDGLGLVLSMVKRLVELHGGTIESSCAGFGKGLSVLMMLPVVDEIIASQAAERAASHLSCPCPPQYTC